MTSSSLPVFILLTPLWNDLIRMRYAAGNGSTGSTATYSTMFPDNTATYDTIFPNTTANATTTLAPDYHGIIGECNGKYNEILTGFDNTKLTYEFSIPPEFAHPKGHGSFYFMALHICDTEFGLARVMVDKFSETADNHSALTIFQEFKNTTTVNYVGERKYIIVFDPLKIEHAGIIVCRHGILGDTGIPGCGGAKIVVLGKGTLVQPNPVKIGSTMTVTCSSDTIGGEANLDYLENLRYIISVELLRQVGNESRESMATYTPMFENNTYATTTTTTDKVAENNTSGITNISGITRNSSTFEGWRYFKVAENNTSGVPRDSYTFEGRGYFHNVDKIKLTLKVDAVSCELVTDYFCKFTYLTTAYKHISKLFIDTTRHMIDVGQLMMTASPSHSDSEGYYVGENILFTCKIGGTQNMQLEWEAARCSAPTVYKRLGSNDQNFVIRDKSKDVTQTECNGPVREYNIELDYKTTDVYCSVRCVAHDKDGKKIEKYHQSSDKNIVKGTKSIVTKIKTTVKTRTKTKTTKEIDETATDATATEKIAYWWVYVIVSVIGSVLLLCLLWYFLCKKKKSKVADNKSSIIEDKEDVESIGNPFASVKSASIKSDKTSSSSVISTHISFFSGISSFVGTMFTNVADSGQQVTKLGRVLTFKKKRKEDEDEDDFKDEDKNEDKDEDKDEAKDEDKVEDKDKDSLR